MPAELEHGLGDEYHLDEVDEDNHEVEDISPTQVPRLGVGLTLTQLDELESMRSLSPVLTLSQVPSANGHSDTGIHSRHIHSFHRDVFY